MSQQQYEEAWAAKFGHNGTHTHRGFIGRCPIRFKDRSTFNRIAQLLRIERRADRPPRNAPSDRYIRRLSLSLRAHSLAITEIMRLCMDVNTLNKALRDREEVR
jgi:hypothetical protein